MSEDRGRWVLDSIGAHDLDVDEVPAAVLADAFFDLARVEEDGAQRDADGRFRAAYSRLDPLDPPLERLRRELGIEPPRWFGKRFAVALTHDVDRVRRDVRGTIAQLKTSERSRAAVRLALEPVYRLRGTDPYWRFEQIVKEERKRGATGSTFFVLGANRDPHDGNAELYEALRPQLVQTLVGARAEIGVHGSYLAAEDPSLLYEEMERLEALGASITGQRYHYLRVDPQRNLAPLQELFAYDSSLGFNDTIGFRAGIAQPFRPWGTDLVEIPLAVMDGSLFERHYLGLSARQAWPRLERLLDWAAENGGGFSILWHSDQFDPLASAGWDRLYFRVLDGVRERGGVCVSAGELAAAYSER